ncbi:Hypothetical predicted protein [Cloeon dipterum]|uniref:Uncharacterized protein n=1 Tax=Cloeon dipterum TaxID=197152 RepID=A0A8S1CTP2_9INSE|nr:Hypothetical predicted protein [Cloeon dipterum]
MTMFFPAVSRIGRTIVFGSAASGMIRGGTCLLLLLVAVARRGDCKPLELQGYPHTPQDQEDFHQYVQDGKFEHLERKFGLQDLLRMLESYIEEPTRKPLAHLEPLTLEQYERLREYHGRHGNGQLMPQSPPLEEPDLQIIDVADLMQPEDDKRGGYMSLCHFKICNMGRKRSVGSPLQALRSP